MIFLAVSCGENQVYSVQSRCPATCQFPLGKYDCGNLKITQECQCKSGFVLNSNGKCIAMNDCGCKLPNSVNTIDAGATVISSDCTKSYFCEGPEKPIVEKVQKACSINADCINVANFGYNCACRAGFSGDGFNCLQLKSFNDKCAETSECSKSLLCKDGTCKCTSDQFWSSLNVVCSKLL